MLPLLPIAPHKPNTHTHAACFRFHVLVPSFTPTWRPHCLQVLDNGVTSNEFWRILDCEEGLDWCVFYYSGAASRAGLSYSGAILASKSGEWPKSQVSLHAAQSWTPAS